MSAPCQKGLLPAAASAACHISDRNIWVWKYRTTYVTTTSSGSWIVVLFNNFSLLSPAIRAPAGAIYYSTATWCHGSVRSICICCMRNLYVAQNMQNLHGAICDTKAFFPCACTRVQVHTVRECVCVYAHAHVPPRCLNTRTTSSMPWQLYFTKTNMLLCVIITDRGRTHRLPIVEHTSDLFDTKWCMEVRALRV